MSRRTRPRRRTRSARLQTPTLSQRARAFVPLRSWKVQLAGAAVAIVVAILSAQSLAAASEAAATYLIKPGDTLSGIAQSTGVPLDKLVSQNGIKNPDLIVAGQTLSLTGATASGGAQYSVKSGDTLWAIAQANATSVADLIQTNNIPDGDQLKVGQVLRIPATPSGGQHAASAAAKPKPPTPSPLQQKVTAEALRVGGPNVHVGVAAINLTTGDKVSLHADDEFPSASVMKLPILVELERQIAAGNLAWTENLRAEVTSMIAISDNTAANEIADAIHPQSVNDTMARLGLGGTHFVNLFNDARNSSNPGENQTTPSNMAHLLELIANDQIINSQASGDIRTLLARNTDRSKLARLLPADAKVGHKSGWYEGVANDVGIVSVDRVPAKWVIAVFTENDPDAETGNQIVAAISKAIYDAWAP